MCYYGTHLSWWESFSFPPSFVIVLALWWQQWSVAFTCWRHKEKAAGIVVRGSVVAIIVDYHKALYLTGRALISEWFFLYSWQQETSLPLWISPGSKILVFCLFFIYLFYFKLQIRFLEDCKELSVIFLHPMLLRGRLFALQHLFLWHLSL